MTQFHKMLFFLRSAFLFLKSPIGPKGKPLGGCIADVDTIFLLAKRGLTERKRGKMNGNECKHTEKEKREREKWANA